MAVQDLFFGFLLSRIFLGAILAEISFSGKGLCRVPIMVILDFTPWMV